MVIPPTDRISENTRKQLWRRHFLAVSHEAKIALSLWRRFFLERLDAIIDLEHGLVRLSGMVPWSTFDEAFGKHYRPLTRSAKPTRSRSARRRKAASSGCAP